jgi:SAM-dependent methyltransferase
VAAELTLTGERTLPGVPVENYWFRRHEAAYAALAPFTVGAVLLEAGCGEGYGAALLSAVAHRVLAVDRAFRVAAHAARRYPGVTVAQADLARLPLPDEALDVVSLLQVIEHLADQEAALAESARVLRPAGTLLLSTPNRLTFSPGRDVPVNPFHTRELSAEDLTTLLDKHFVITRLLGLRHGRRLRRWERRHGPLVDAQLAGPAVGWPPTLRRRVERVRCTDFQITARDPDSALDLLVVAYRRP